VRLLRRTECGARDNDFVVGGATIALLQIRAIPAKKRMALFHPEPTSGQGSKRQIFH